MMAKAICPGIARQHGLRVSGRRNAIGDVLGKRPCVWYSECCRLHCVVSRCNTHNKPHIRIPILPQTHEKTCNAGCLDDVGLQKTMQIAVQRAMMQMTRHFGGYIAKRRKLAGFETKVASATLPRLQNKMKTQNTARAQLASATHRLFATMEGQSALRSGTEEYNLALHMDHHDVLQSDFVRAFRNVSFLGLAYLYRLDFERRRRKPSTRVLATKVNVLDTGRLIYAHMPVIFY
mgnify:CR=1 FL=1